MKTMTKKHALLQCAFYALNVEEALTAKVLEACFESTYTNNSIYPEQLKLWVNAFNRSLDEANGLANEFFNDEFLQELKTLYTKVLKISKNWVQDAQDILLDIDVDNL